MKPPIYWNTKYLQSPILYQGRSLFLNDGKNIIKIVPLTMDVRRFIQYPDFHLNRIVKDEGIWDLPTDEEKALACLRFVRKHVQYTPDKTNYGVNEMWQFPNETLALGLGDCEEGALLWVSLMRNARVPAYRCKVAAGFVVVGPTAPLGGHAYPLFLRSSDEEWITCDWCYLFNDLEINKRTPVKNDPNYKDVWFTFNDELSWSAKPITVEKSVKNTAAFAP